MKQAVLLACAAAPVLLALSAYAAGPQECKARVLVPVTDDMGNAWKTGSILPVNIARDGANGGTFCASGGSCLPRTVNGSKALVLLNCKVGPSLGDGDSRLVPDASLSGAAAANALRSLQNATDKLSDLGFSNASAGSLADDYVNHPRSQNGRLVARAFAGSASALATLKRSNP